MYETNKPTTVQGTSRQRIVTRSGVTLDRQYVFMPEASWLALQRLCVTQQRSGSQVIQSLISLADLGTRKDAHDIEANRTK
jgi:hypothetical protein